MLRRIRKLVNEPAFRSAPLAVLLRIAQWGWHVCAHKLWGKPPPVFRLTSHGEFLKVPADLRFTSLSAFLLRDWAEPELHALDLFVKDGECFIDVGANIGLYTLKAARLTGPKGCVVAVEPGATARVQLKANLELNPFRHVHIVDKALAERAGTATLHHVDVGNDPQAFSLIGNASDIQTGETVTTATLDEIVSTLGGGAVHAIKIDVEGFEEPVLKGACGTLLRWKPIVILEINAPTLRQSGQPLDGAWRELQRHGYAFYRLDGRCLSPLEEMPDTFGNIVARHPEGRRA